MDNILVVFFSAIMFMIGWISILDLMIERIVCAIKDRRYDPGHKAWSATAIMFTGMTLFLLAFWSKA